MPVRTFDERVLIMVRGGVQYDMKATRLKVCSGDGGARA
jgi:hypothetical protein